MATYKIILKNETSDEEDENTGVAGSESGKEPKKEKKQLSNAQIVVGKGLVAFNLAKPWINQVASHEISMVELRTGSKEAQQKAQFAYNIANQVGGFVGSILTGYAVGNLPGAIIGALTNVGHTLISLDQRERTINLQRSLESRTLQMNYVRAGAGGSRKGYE